MMSNFNWKEYVSLQSFEANPGFLFYLQVRNNGRTDKGEDLVMSVMKELIECTLTEQEVAERVEDMLQQFPIKRSKVDVRPELMTQARLIEIDMLKNQVAQATRRGRPNKQHGDTFFYLGDSKTDAPIFVVQFEDKFGIFKHPKFDDFGFNYK